jgi:hypothetical protein
MDAQITDLVKRTAQASVRYAAMAGGGLLILNILSKIPIIGLLFLCIYGLCSLGAAVGIGYLMAPTVSPLPYGQSKAMLALWIGLGVAIPLSVALTIASVLGTLFDIAIDHSSYSLIGGLFALIGSVFGGIIGGLIIGTALAWLGSFFSLDKNPNLAAATQMTQPPARPF